MDANAEDRVVHKLLGIQYILLELHIVYFGTIHRNNAEFQQFWFISVTYFKVVHS